MTSIYSCLLTDTGRVSAERCKRYKVLVKDLTDKYNTSIPEALFIELKLNSIKPTCMFCSSSPKFYNFKTGYSSTCTAKSCIKEAQSLRVKTFYANPLARATHSKQQPKRIWTADQLASQKATNLERYGVSTPLQLGRVRMAANAAFKSLGGRSAVMKQSGSKHSNQQLALTNFLTARLPIILDHGIVPNFDPNTYQGSLLQYNWKHSCGFNFMSTLESGKLPKCPRCAPRSLPQQRLVELLISQLPAEYSIQQNNRKLLGGKELDIVIHKHGLPVLAIEVNGVYWHSTDVNPDKHHLAKKHDLAESVKIQLMSFYDIEVLKQPELIISMCMSKLNLTTRLYARKLLLRDVSVQDARSFLEKNHMQGYVACSKRLGLYNGDELVQLMTVGPARFRVGYDELLRMASAQNITVVGGMSKLLRALQTDKPMVSYANRRWSSGAAYRKLGFTQLTTDVPSYSYYKHKYGMLSRYQCQKHKLKQLLVAFDESVSETTNMLSNGFLKLYDAGSLTFIKHASSQS